MTFKLLKNLINKRPNELRRILKIHTLKKITKGDLVIRIVKKILENEDQPRRNDGVVIYDSKWKEI